MGRMYKLLVVEDDEIMREGIIKNIKWTDYGFTPFSASNGIEGVEMAKKLSPNVIISDICMPFMDGLKMIEQIETILPEIKIILLTAYDDFKYAKRAITLKVTEYILKCSDIEEILAVVLKVKSALDLESIQREKELKVNELTKGRFFSDLILGTAGGEDFERGARSLDIRFEGVFFCIAVIKINDFSDFSLEDNPRKFGHTLYSMINICNQLLVPRKIGHVFVNLNQEVNILFNVGKKSDSAAIEEALNEITGSVESCLNIRINVGVGNIYEGYKSIPSSYDEAMIALRLKDTVAGKKIIFAEEVKGNEASSHNKILKKIVGYVENNYSNENLTLALISSEVYLSPAYISTLFRKYKGVNFIDYVTNVRISKAKALLESADIKTYEVSEKVGYSNPQYFSVLFKKMTGMSPTEYKSAKKGSS